MKVEKKFLFDEEDKKAFRRVSKIMEVLEIEANESLLVAFNYCDLAMLGDDSSYAMDGEFLKCDELSFETKETATFYTR